RLIGANADLLQRLGKELGVRIDVLYSGSWEKAQEEVTSGRADLLAGAYLTLARLGSMDYVHPPFLMTSGVVWVNKDAAFPFIGRDDLIGHKGSVLAGSSLGEEFDRFAKASLDLKPVPSLTQGLQDLMLKRSEFLLYQALPGQAQVEALGMADDLEALEPVLSSEGLYLTLSHNSACNDPWLRGQLAKKMTELSAAGVPVTLLQDNLERWKAQQLPASGASSTTQESDL
ncbi:transporter substrate-binding domain-containing protein, partial [Pseudomonas aeruginosa]|nr:transporter substrate-binding domain-containing protein [Pseudomonas aeruginosa]